MAKTTFLIFCFLLVIDCPFAEIKMTFLNFGQKAGFYRQTCSKLPKVVAIFVELLRAFRMSKATPAIYGDLQRDTAVYSDKINSRFQKIFSEW
jgi:hypothetical protein